MNVLYFFGTSENNSCSPIVPHWFVVAILSGSLTFVLFLSHVPVQLGRRRSPTSLEDSSLPAFTVLADYRANYGFRRR